jgi:hypothetical protein
MNARQDLIDLFSGPRRRVIEIGSGSGDTGLYCKQKFPGVEYWGFETDKAAATASLTRLDKTVCGRFEEQSLSVLGMTPHSVDGVVLDGALARMADPWRTLTALLPWLTEDAELAVSLPNLRNLWLLNEIAEGRFTYGADGLPDMAQLRFFTLREIQGLMESSGYTIVQASIVPDPRLAEFQAQHARVRGPGVFHYKSIGIQLPGAVLPELCARQFVLRAAPRRLFRDLKPVTHAESAQRLAADYDEAFQSDPVHYVPQLPPAPATPRIPVDLYAFYLPQYHPTPRNSQWWGEGFTEWSNVARARPSFNGHYQPRHPGELGYYDLRVDEVMARQAELAKQAGLAGVIFYYYWFSGTPVLDMPLKQYMTRWQELGLPFMVMWCNENWRRSWVSSATPPEQQDLLMAHLHLPDDPERFIDDLHPVFSHPGYVRIDGRPVLLVYPMTGRNGSLSIAASRANVARWRTRARQTGLGELWIGTWSGGRKTADTLRAPQDLGADFFFDFPPNHAQVNWTASDSTAGVHDFYDPDQQITLLYYEALMDKLRALPPPATPLVKTVLAGSWDNTARKERHATVFHGGTPPLYERWLRESAQFAQAHPGPGGKAMVFINAWNEWAEGVYLEPDRKYGYALLAATQRVAFGQPPG